MFRVAAWLFLVAVTCDEANVDDLFRGVIVIHDDADIAVLDACFSSGAAPAIPRSDCSSSRIDRSWLLFRCVNRLIVDQDSPSLGAGEDPPVQDTPIAFQHRSTPVSFPHFSADHLHLRFHSLLI